MAIRILRSDTTATPVSLDIGQLAYSNNNGTSSGSGNLFIGASNGTTTDVIKIGGAADVAKLATIEVNAQVNTVDSVNGQTGVVDLSLGDLSGIATDFTTQLGLNVLGALSNVDETGASNGQFLQFDGSSWSAAAVPGGVTDFDGLNDTPASKVADNYLMVDGTGTNLVYTPDIDDGNF